MDFWCWKCMKARVMKAMELCFTCSRPDNPIMGRPRTKGIVESMSLEDLMENQLGEVDIPGQDSYERAATHRLEEKNGQYAAERQSFDRWTSEELEYFSY